MSQSRRLRPSELGYSLLMLRDEEDLRCALRTCPRDDELARSIVDEGLFLGFFAFEQRELLTKALVETGALEQFRKLLLERLDGRNLDEAEFRFMDSACSQIPGVEEGEANGHTP